MPRQDTPGHKAVGLPDSYRFTAHRESQCASSIDFVLNQVYRMTPRITLHRHTAEIHRVA